jgi:hypothetical protein
VAPKLLADEGEVVVGDAETSTGGYYWIPLAVLGLSVLLFWAAVIAAIVWLF